MEKLKDYFKRYPASQEVYENGGQLFHSRGAADSYRKGETRKYTRKEVESPEAPAGMTKQDAVKALKEADSLAMVAIDDLKMLAGVLELKVDDNKKDTLVKALTEYKETLKDK